MLYVFNNKGFFINIIFFNIYMKTLTAWITIGQLLKEFKWVDETESVSNYPFF